jgi:hypothetical protein
MTDADLMQIDCEIRAPVPWSRVKRVLQPMAEISLQIRCRCSDEPSFTQSLIVVCSNGHAPASRVPA